MIHILEKSQTDVFLDFKKTYPGIKICQRSFERCKPYYVQAVRPKDRQTCVCTYMYHIEAKTLFSSCMNFRKTVLTDKIPEVQQSTPVYEHLNDIIKSTLCPTEDEPLMKCLNRNCNDCGVGKF